ncbi:MAG: hypothetical protein ABIH87_00480 [bacterium]
MGNIQFCDLCNKKQGKKDQTSWPSISINHRDLELPGFSRFYDTYDLCPKCAKITLEKIGKLLKKKK